MSSIADFTEVFTLNTFAKPPSADFQLNFLRDIQWLLESSSYTSTYKFALLMALANLSIESGIDDNSPHTISYKQLAEQFIQLYWLQALPFAAQNEDSILRQSATKGQASVITLILNLQSDTQQTSLNKARTSDAKQWQSTISKVARVIKTYPAKHLQSAENNNNREFMYFYDAKSNEIVLKPGISYCLSRFSKIINKLCQQYWSDFVRKNSHNQGYFSDDIDLKQFLFQQPRLYLGKLQEVLIDAQHGQCFYCHKPLKEDAKNRTEVDHFIPWSKYPVDTVHNFVLADHSCNNRKRDYLAEEMFYEQWLVRNQRYGQTIEAEAQSQNLGFISNRQRSETVSQWAYQLAVEYEDLVWSPHRGLQIIEPGLLPNLRGF
jgi:hypothetical protein